MKLNKEELFIESLYDEANEQLKEVYKVQRDTRNELLQEIAMVMLTYTILDGLMNIKKNDRDKIYKKISSLIITNYKAISNKEVDVLSSILESTVKKAFNFYSYNVNLKDVKKIVESNFKGKHFSERVWSNEKEVARHLHKKLNDFLKGRVNVNQIRNDIIETFNTSAYNSKRLVETEVSRVSSNAFDRFCKETGVKKVKYNATLENTCKICLNNHGEIFNLDSKPETPRHPNCKCFYEVYE